MTHKQECLCYCIEHLESRSLSHVIDKSIFEHYYRKFNGAWGNAWHVGLSAADMMIENYKPKTQEVSNDRGNESEERIAKAA
jgi:uncharacterized UPF0160 family protein